MGFDYWPFATLDPVVVERSQDGVAVADRTWLVAVVEVLPEGDGVDAAGELRSLRTRRTARLGRAHQPEHEVAVLNRGRSVPLHLDGTQEAPPPLQRKGVAPHALRRVPSIDEVAEEQQNGLHRCTRRVDDDVRHHVP